MGIPAPQAESLTRPGARLGLRLPSRATVVTVLLALALQWAIARIYADLIVELFGGARAAQLSGGLEVPIAYLFTAVCAAATAWYCQRRSGPSRVILVVHLIAVIIPLQALVAAKFELARAEFAAAVALAYLGTLALAGRTPELVFPPAGRAARGALLVVVALLTTYVFAALIGHGGLGRMSFDLAQVYKVREQFVEQLGPLVGYVVPWQGVVLNPALMLAGIKRRSLILVVTGLALQALLFGMTGFRSYLLVPALLLGLYAIGRRRNLGAIALAGIMAIVAGAIGLYLWLDAPVIPALLVDRVIVVPAELHYWYYDFFGTHGQAPLQLSQSIFAAFSTSHYSAPIAEVIAWKYMGVAASANVGVFADAFANFGFAGCAIFMLLFAMVLKAADAASRNVDPRVAAALVGLPAFQLVNSGLLTTLLTHGLALAIVVLWAFPFSRAPRSVA